jgi:hypothetical protein
MVWQSAWQLPKARDGGFSKMNSHHLRNKVGRILLGLAFVAGIGIASSTAVQAQYPQWPYGQDPYRRDRDRDYRRDDRYGRNGGYGNISQIAINQGYQDGVNTGSRDAERRQSYDPQRSHFYRNGHGDNGGYGRIDDSYQFQQAYRSGFLRGYQEGYRRYGGYNRGNNGRNNGRYGRWPF